MKPCTNCGKSVDDYLNYCDWSCHVDYCKKLGGREHCPNGLPVGCIRADGTMLEIEGGDHPDYKFPVEAVYVGPIDADDYADYEMMGGSDPDEDKVRDFKSETHALIYTDGCIAVTTYECCYAMWSLVDGKIEAGNMWKKSTWKLADSSLKKIRELAEKT